MMELSDLTLKDKVYLGAFVRGATRIIKNKLIFRVDSFVKITPIYRMDKEIYRYLQKNEICTKDESNDERNFLEITIKHNINSDLYSHEEISVLLKQCDPLVYGPIDKSEFDTLIMEISIAEAIEYLALQFEYRGFNVPNIGPQYEEVFRTMLLTLRIEQVYYFIWATIRDASSLKRTTTRLSSLLTSIPSRIMSKFTRSQERDWVIEGFRRPAQCCESEMRIILEKLIDGHV